MTGLEMMLKQVGFDPEAIKKVLLEAKQTIDSKLAEIDAKLSRIEEKLDAQNGAEKHGRGNRTGTNN